MSTVRLATLKDSRKIKDILFKTATWLNEKGSKQWSGLLKGEDVHNIEEAINREEVYLVYVEDKLIGTFALWDKQTGWDKDLWNENESRDYLYLHRIALSEDSHGKNLGKELLNSAKQIARDANKKGIRLDCIASNRHLNNYYQSNGFTYFKTIKNYDNGEGLQDYNLFYWKSLKNS